MSEAQSELKGFQCIRSDRDSRKGGGRALYLHSKVVPSHQISFSDNSNNMVAVYVESLHTIFAVVYRPPDSPGSDFSNCMDKLQEMIEMIGIQMCTLLEISICQSSTGKRVQFPRTNPMERIKGS